MKNNRFRSIPLLIMVIVYISSIFNLPGTNFAANTVEGHPYNYILWFLYSVVAILLYSKLLSLFSILNIKPLVNLGENSMTYYVCHFPFMFLSLSFFNDYLEGYQLYFAVFLMTMVICCIIDKLLKKSKYSFILGI